MFSFQNAIQQFLDERGFTQAELAGLIGAQANQVSAYVRGADEPSDEKCFALERLMGLPRQFLVVQRALNRLESKQVDMGMFIDPAVWEARGLRRGLNSRATLNAREKTAVYYTSGKDWRGMINWALDHIEKGPEESESLGLKSTLAGQASIINVPPKKKEPEGAS